MGACSTKPSRVTEENLTEPGTPPPEEEDKISGGGSRDSYSSNISAGSRTFDAQGKLQFKVSAKQKEAMGKIGE